jgi:sulfatase modifying factor 1
MTVEPEVINIPAGEFLMGCDVGAANERPVHRVFVDEFAIGRFAVTNELYRSFIEDTGHAQPPGWTDSRFNHPEQPVTSVCWFDATVYCEWLSKKTGKLYRLPTEAEWERAARAGLEGKLYTWGDESPQHQPNYSELWVNGPERVGQRPANGFGLYDMSENVHEWCSDWYDERYYFNSPSSNPQGPATGMRRSSRGGSWRHQIKITRVAARSSIPPEFRYADYGFRLRARASRPPYEDLNQFQPSETHAGGTSALPGSRLLCSQLSSFVLPGSRLLSNSRASG